MHPDLAGVVTNRCDAGCGATAPDAHGTGMTGAISRETDCMAGHIGFELRCADTDYSASRPITSASGEAAVDLGNPTAETDSVAGHIGFELRCAERIFISLRKSKGSDLRTPVRTVARPRRIIFSARLDCLLFARAFVERRTQRARSFSTSEFESSQAAVSHIATLPQVSRSARCSRMLRLDRAW
jgi:hypothetical protein